MIYRPYSQEMQNDPYRAYRWFLENDPCHYNPDQDFYALFRFDDVWEGLKNSDLFSAECGNDLDQRTPVPPESGSLFAVMDPPRHGHFRGPFNREFSPKNLRPLEEEIRKLTIEYISKILGKGEETFKGKWRTRSASNQ